MFNFKARAISSDWSADSRGLMLNPNNAGPISEVALRRMEMLGVQPINGLRSPKIVRETDFENSAQVIAMSREEHYRLMTKLFPAYAERIGYWNVEDTGEMPPDAALARIEFLVDKLIEKVSTQHYN